MAHAPLCLSPRRLVHEGGEQGPGLRTHLEEHRLVGVAVRSGAQMIRQLVQLRVRRLVGPGFGIAHQVGALPTRGPQGGCELLGALLDEATHETATPGEVRNRLVGGIRARLKGRGPLERSRTGFVLRRDALLRRLLVAAAHYVLGAFGPDTELRRFGLRLAERGGNAAKKRAMVAVARRLAVLLHRLWMTGEMYQPLGYDGSVAQAA